MLPQVHHLVACEVEHAVLVPLVQTQTVEVVIAGHEDDTEPHVIVLKLPKNSFGDHSRARRKRQELVDVIREVKKRASQSE